MTEIHIDYFDDLESSLIDEMIEFNETNVVNQPNVDIDYNIIYYWLDFNDRKVGITFFRNSVFICKQVLSEIRQVELALLRDSITINNENNEPILETIHLTEDYFTPSIAKSIDWNWQSNPTMKMKFIDYNVTTAVFIGERYYIEKNNE